MSSSDGIAKSDVTHRAARIFLVAGSILLLIYFFGALSRSGIAFAAIADIPKVYVLGLKGIAEGLLVAAAFLGAQSITQRKLTPYILIIFIADMALAFGLVTIAGVIFVLAHILASVIYFKFPDTSRSPLIKIFGAVPLILSVAACGYWIFQDTFNVTAIFPIFSAIAVFAATRSLYPNILGLGTCVLWVSDMVFVVALMSGIDVTAVGWLIWLTFAAGFALIVAGVIKRLSLSF